MERKVFRTYRSETTSSCEYFHLVVMVVLDVVVVVVLVLVVRQAMREDLQLWEGEREAVDERDCSETVACRY